MLLLQICEARPSWCRGRVGVVLFVAALVFVAGLEPALAADKGTYRAPDISRFVLVGEEDGDGDGDGIKETHILRYRNTAGDSVFNMTTKGQLWAWSLSSHEGADPVDPERNYVLRDSDCDGTFDERYGLVEEFHVPDCVKDNSQPASSR